MLALLNRECMVSSDRQLYGNVVPHPHQIITYYWQHKKPGTQIKKLKKGWRFGSCWWFLRSHGQISSNYKELCSKSSESLYFSHWGYPNILPPGIVLLRCHDQLILGFVGSRRSWELCGVNEGSWKICKGWQNVLEKLWPGIVLEPNNLAMRERERESYLYIIYIIYPKIKATIYKLYIYSIYIYICVCEPNYPWSIILIIYTSSLQKDAKRSRT